MDYLTQAILSLRSGSQFSFDDNDYSTIHWDILEGKAPTQSEIDAEIKKIKLQEDSAKAALEVKKQEVLDKLGLSFDDLAALIG
jgi:hypothetical protein